jgi:putative SOS response-associated peptidase YedK
VCSNYEPVTDTARLLAAFGVTLPAGAEFAPYTSAGVMSPFIVRSEAKVPDVLGEVKLGIHGLLPNFATSVEFAENTYNCRAETMKSKPAFRESWWAGRRCVIPVEKVSEWCHETERAEMYAVGLADGGPMGLAGLWYEWTGRDGEKVLSFCMLTINADGHAVFQRMNRPGDEKRMPVILPSGEQELWLYGSMAAAESLLVRFPAEDLQAVLIERAARPVKEPPGWAAMPDMFEDEWRVTAAELPKKKPAKASRNAMPPPPPELPGPTTGDLFG